MRYDPMGKDYSLIGNALSGLKAIILNNLHVSILIIILLQPVLDAISYWLAPIGLSVIVLGIRAIIMLCLLLTSYILANKKRFFYIYYGVIALFWLAHMINCYRVGYANALVDTIFFIKSVQLVILVYPIIQIFRIKGINKTVELGFASNIVIISVIILVSIITNTMAPTYYYTNMGVLGWLDSGNAQSAILVSIIPLAIYFGISKNKILFILITVLSFLNLYFIGTRVAYFSIFVISFGLLCTILISRKRVCNISIVHISGLLIMSILCVSLYTYSPLYVSNTTHASDMAKHYTATVQNNNNAVNPGNKPTTTLTDEQKYGALYEKYLNPLVLKFGLDRVIKEYNGATALKEISDARETKLMLAKMSWDDTSFATKLFGFEYMTMNVQGTQYDLENDLHTIFYFYGYLGFALYILFLSYFVIAIGIALIKRFKATFTIQFGALCISAVLLLGSAGLAGHTFTRPNVAFFCAFALAYLYTIASNKNRANI